MAEILADPSIPSKSLRQQVFPKRGGQQLVPFLGAGASLGASPGSGGKEAPKFPTNEELEAVLAKLGLSGEEFHRQRLLVRFSIALAYLMLQASNAGADAEADILEALVAAPYPPSAGRLVDLFATLSDHSAIRLSAASLLQRWPSQWDAPKSPEERKQWLREVQQAVTLLIDTAELYGAKDTLTTIAAHYETVTGRKNLWDQLAQIFRGKLTPTPTHLLIARAAANHLEMMHDTPYDKLSTAHYLIVSTNYDGLMEQALGKLPYVVLYLNRKKDYKVYAKFSASLGSELAKLQSRNKEAFPHKFVLDLDEPIVVLYKVHGCLAPGQTFADDSVVITDFDYEDYIAEMAKKGQLVPTAVSNLMHDKAFLFLGYSLSDWNIRTILTALMRRREEGQGRDYAVMKNISKSADAYCTRRHIVILNTGLDEFAQEITPPDRRSAAVEAVSVSE
jgi:hypothetical protein